MRRGRERTRPGQDIPTTFADDRNDTLHDDTFPPQIPVLPIRLVSAPAAENGRYAGLTRRMLDPPTDHHLRQSRRFPLSFSVHPGLPERDSTRRRPLGSWTIRFSQIRLCEVLRSQVGILLASVTRIADAFSPRSLLNDTRDFVLVSAPSPSSD
jgi:hypothetical protein